MNRLSTAYLAAAVILAVGALVVPLVVLPATYLTVDLGTISGVGAGFLVTAGLFYAQTPRITAVPADSRYKKDSGPHWVHIEVANGASGFLGGGAANDLRGFIKFDERDQVYEVKWKSKPNPVRLYPIATSTGIRVLQVADDQLYDQAKTQSLPPQSKPEWLDVAFKAPDDPNCYVSIPENFKTREFAATTTAGVLTGIVTGPGKFVDCRLGDGPHPFTLELRNAGLTLLRKRFILCNGGGTDPGSLRVEIAAPS
jgi:hypothetical protein